MRSRPAPNGARTAVAIVRADFGTSRCEHTGKVFAIGLLINDIGPCRGTLPVGSGPSAITITADGGGTAARG